MSDDLFPENFGAIFPILGVALHKGPPIDITNIGPSIGSKQIEPANILSELFDYPVADVLFFGGQDDGEPGFFALFVANDDAIEGGGLSGLSVHVVGSDCVDFDIETVGLQVILVDEVAVSSDLVFLENRVFSQKQKKTKKQDNFGHASFNFYLFQNVPVHRCFSFCFFFHTTNQNS